MATNEQQVEEMCNMISTLEGIDDVKMGQWVAGVSQLELRHYKAIKAAERRSPAALRACLEGLLTPGVAGPGPSTAAGVAGPGPSSQAAAAGAAAGPGPGSAGAAGGATGWWLSSAGALEARQQGGGGGEVPGGAGEWVQPAPDYQTGSGGLSFVRDRVSRLVHRGCTIGTCFRLAHGIILTCRHCVVDNGMRLHNLRAFGGRLQHVACFPAHDVAVLRGPEGPHFLLAGGHERSGVKVSAVGFPQAVDADLEFGVASATPTCTWGRLSAISDSGAIAAADYTGVLPNSSGGPVLLKDGLLAGLHTGLTYHRAALPAAAPAARRSSSGGGTPPDTIETTDSCYPDPVEPDLDADIAAQTSLINIDMKGYLALLVPAGRLRECLARAGVVGQEPLTAARDALMPHVRRIERVQKRSRSVPGA